MEHNAELGIPNLVFIVMPSREKRTLCSLSTHRKTMSRSPRKIALMPAIGLLIAGLSPYTLISAETSATTTGERRPVLTNHGSNGSTMACKDLPTPANMPGSSVS
jgi:hypothetical protein